MPWLRLRTSVVAAALCLATASARARPGDSFPDLEPPESEPQLWAPLRRPEPPALTYTFPIAGFKKRVVTGVHEGNKQEPAEITRTYDKAGKLLSYRRVEGGTGLQVLKAVKSADPGVAFVVFSNNSAPAYRKRYLGEGAVRFLDKSTEFDQLAQAVATAGRRVH